jgi:hypothetical protein
MISDHTSTGIEVVSFTNGPDLKYTITIAPESNTMISCTCIDYLQNGHNCKHMYLVNMLESIALKPHSTGPSQTITANQQPLNDEEVMFDESIAR